MFDVCVLAGVQCVGFILSAVVAYIIYDASLGSDTDKRPQVSVVERPISTAEIKPEIVTPPKHEFRIAKRWSVSPDKSNRLDLSDRQMSRQMDELAGDVIPVAFQPFVEPWTSRLPLR